MIPLAKHPFTALCALALSLTLQVNSSHASNIAQIPLFLTQSVDPNLMFVIDDSGSMYWSYMPDGIRSIATANRAKSVTINKVYYDPTFTYQPPIDHNGNSLGNASFTAAWFDGYASNRSASTVNLSTSFRPTWHYSYSTDAYAGAAEPAYYYNYNSACGNINNDACYSKVVVSATSGPSGTDERQNFANWYSYYRTRMYASRAGIGFAFEDLPSNFRLGWGEINRTSTTIDGTSVDAVSQGVRTLTNSHKQSFYDWLYAVPPTGNTPLPRALRGAGRYFENTTDRGPWSSTPGQTGGEDFECRRSYTILMSDGYWNVALTSGQSVGNADGTAGQTITGFDINGNPLSYQYSPQSPFSDTNSNTLADVAMQFWKRDLAPDLGNRVPTTQKNPAFWQHMVTYAIGLGVQGSITPPTTAQWNDIENWTPGAAWPNPTSDPAKIDDMLHAAVNGRGGFFSANEPDVFASELNRVIKEIIAEAKPSSASVAANSTRLSTNTFVYQARFDSSDWSGSLLAFQINPDGSINTTPAWDAADAIPVPAARNIFTIDPAAAAGSRGRNFDWSALNTAQQGHLGTQSVLNYIRGETGDPSFRPRASLLGDIVHSQPVFVGRQNYGYGLAQSLTTTERAAYNSFRTGLTRPEVVYAGANAGMLHAFQVSGTADGAELFAFVPNSVFPNLPELTKPDYSHLYFVDGPPRVSDALVGGSWRTMLVGSTGAGGKSYFGLDVTNPQTFSSSDVRWEFTHGELGYTVGQAAIGRTQSGHWVAIFGNGYESASGKAQLLVVDLWSGALLKQIDTGIGSLADPNGLGTPVAIDATRDGSIDTVYAGDMHGNLWKFDFTGNNTNGWDISFKSGSTPQPLFTAVGPNGERQPITAKPQVGVHKEGGLAVYVGTGKFFELGDEIVGTNPPVQSFYGIRDVCGPATGSTCERVQRSQMQQQTIFFESQEDFGTETYDIRLLTNNATVDTQRGFYIDLISPVLGRQGERVVSEAVIWNDRIIFTTLIPDPDPCGTGGTSWLMEIDPFTGGRLAYSVFDLNADGLFDDSDMYVDPVTGEKYAVSGIRSSVGIVRTPTPLYGQGAATKILSGTAAGGPGGQNLESVLNRDPLEIGRQSWEQLQ